MLKEYEYFEYEDLNENRQSLTEVNRAQSGSENTDLACPKKHL